MLQKNNKNVSHYIFGKNSVKQLNSILETKKTTKDSKVIFFIDHFFKNKFDFLDESIDFSNDIIIFHDTSDEPSTSYIDGLISKIKIETQIETICAVVGVGGGATMDVAKAVSNLLRNPGSASDYQGWDLVKNPGVYKIGIPTISGTGSESTRTCVMTNTENGLKLGMNSDFTVFDQIILDYELTKTVPRDQFFYTGMDSYIHCIESLNGRHRNSIGDAYSIQTVKLCEEIFLSDDMMKDECREKLMVASYLGGCAIATSYVGLIHPFSAGLSVVLGIHHCEANCIVLNAMEDFYPKEYSIFQEMVSLQKVNIQKNITRNLTSEEFNSLYSSTVIHEKPLKNALGDDYLKILNKDRVKEIFSRM